MTDNEVVSHSNVESRETKICDTWAKWKNVEGEV